ncbi:MAG: hypothetical protein HZC41_15120 [Chloroflexi bacterium]|nr:hypothetical protein [Chloroflexota bacterium]
MTLDELKVLINQEIDQRLQSLSLPKTTRTVKEINESIRRHRWTPPPGSKSSLELLREDRDA